jgi:uncharacterized paraquat-inducible protein A
MEMPPYLPYFQKFKCPLCKENIALWYIANNKELNCPSCEALLSSNFKEASKKAYSFGVSIFLVLILIELFLTLVDSTWIKIVVAFGGVIAFYVGYLFFLKKFKIFKV